MQPKDWWNLKRGDIVDCYKCSQPKPIFTMICTRREFLLDQVFSGVCEQCAEQLPEQYICFTSSDGTSQLISDGTLESALRVMSKQLREYGTSKVSRFRLIRIPGKYTSHSTLDQLKYGQSIPFSCELNGKVTVN